MLLNLGCGSDFKPGWVNLDAVAWEGYRPPDLLWDARKDSIPFLDNSAETIYMGYLLMHLNHRYHAQLLTEVYRVLSPTGVLLVGEVDMSIVMARWLARPTEARLSELIWGEMGSAHGEAMAEWDKHCHGFTESSLRELLLTHGFRNITRVSIHHADVFYELTLQMEK